MAPLSFSRRAMSVLLVLLVSICTVTESITPEQRRLIDELVGIYMRDNFTPALALSIVEYGNGNTGINDSVSLAYGKSRLETNTTATNQTLFAIGSISKSFTGILAVKVLHEKFPQLGGSVLDRPIKELVPDFNFTFSDRFRSESASFRDLLSHRTCLSNLGVDAVLGMNSEEDYIYRTRYQMESCPFRGGYSYNNNLFALAGQMLAHVAGVTFQELTSSFFAQLGMYDTRLADKDGAHELSPTMSHAYFRKDNQTHQYNTTHLRRLSVIGGAGAVLSTAVDMTQYVEFHLNKGRVGNVQVIPEEVYNWAAKQASVIPSGGGVDAGPLGHTGMYGYGLGLILAVHNGNPWILHSGYWPPYESAFGLFLQQKIGIFISTNGPGSAGTYPGQLSQQLLEVMIFDILRGNRTTLNNVHEIISLWPKPKPKPTNTTEEKPARRRTQIHAVTGKQCNNRTKVDPIDIVGRYGSPADGEAVITLEDQRLSINLGTWGLGTLVSKSGSEIVFAIEWISPVEDEFYSYGNIEEIPRFEADFGIEDQFELRATSGESIVLVKDRVLNSLPAIPWEPQSCGPRQGNMVPVG